MKNFIYLCFAFLCGIIAYYAYTIIETEQHRSFLCNFGHAESCAALGKSYILGLNPNTEPDYLQAKEYLEKACNLNNSRSCVYLGKLYGSGLGVTKDYTQAKGYYEKACNRLNDGRGCGYLSYSYSYGFGVSQNMEGAKLYAGKACKLEDAGCFFELAVAMKIANNAPGGIEMSELDTPEKIINFLDKITAYSKKQCDNDDEEACAFLGALYITKENNSHGLSVLEKACNMNSAFGCGSLGDYYAEGKGGEPDYSKAKSYYEKGCKIDLTGDGGCSKLGTLYAEGTHVKQNYALAKTLFEKACNMNDAEGCAGLGNLFLSGSGVRQDYDTALSYFTVSCNLDEGKGCYALGYMYQSGKGVTEDYSKAIDYYEKSCSLREGSGCLMIGMVLELADNEQSKTEAREYYGRACDLGEQTGCELYKKLNEEGEGKAKGNKNDYEQRLKDIWGESHNKRNK